MLFYKRWAEMKDKTRIKKNMSGYIMTLPALIFIVIFIAIPGVLGLYYSFHKWDGFNEPIYVGFKNYIKIIFNDNTFHTSFKNTLIYAIVVVTAKNILGLLLA